MAIPKARGTAVAAQPETQNENGDPKGPRDYPCPGFLAGYLILSPSLVRLSEASKSRRPPLLRSAALIGPSRSRYRRGASPKLGG